MLMEQNCVVELAKKTIIQTTEVGNTQKQSCKVVIGFHYGSAFIFDQQSELITNTTNPRHAW